MLCCLPDSFLHSKDLYFFSNNKSVSIANDLNYFYLVFLDEHGGPDEAFSGKHFIGAVPKHMQQNYNEWLTCKKHKTTCRPGLASAMSKVIFNPGPFPYLLDVFIDSKNRVLLCGSANDKLVLWRFLSSGAQDSAFGKGGVVSIQHRDDFKAWCHSAVVDDVGNIYVAGFSGKIADKDKFLFRFTESGQLDTTFSGMAPLLPASLQTATDKLVAINKNGRILLKASLGTSDPNRNWNTGIWAFTPDGKPDTSFGNQGIAEIPGPGKLTMRGMKIDAANRILIFGNIEEPVPARMPDKSKGAIWRLLPNGLMDGSFGSGGLLLLEPSIPQNWSAVCRLEIDQNDKYLALLRRGGNAYAPCKGNADVLKISNAQGQWENYFPDAQISERNGVMSLFQDRNYRIYIRYDMNFNARTRVFNPDGTVSSHWDQPEPERKKKSSKAPR